MKSFLKPMTEPLGPAGLRALEDHTKNQIAEHERVITELRQRLEAEKTLVRSD